MKARAAALFGILLFGSWGLAEAAKRKSPKPQERPAAQAAAPERPAPEQIPVIDIDKQPPVQASSESSKPGPAPSGSRIAQAGLLADSAGAALSVREVFARSFSDSLGLRAGDALLYLNGEPVPSAAFSADASSFRNSAVVSRSGEIAGAQTSIPPPERSLARDPDHLSALERRLSAEQMEEAGRQVPAFLKALKTPAFSVPAGETLWISFPKGVPRTLSEGDIIEGEVSTPMAMDSSLDYLAVPVRSRVWAQVVAAPSVLGSALALRLHIYKLALAGGHTYPCSASIADISGEQTLLRVSGGGSLVAAPSATDIYVAEPARNFQIRFLQPLTIHESRDFFRAGPGLWFKTANAVGKGKTFEITRVFDKRAAQYAGLRVGDRIIAIEGRSVERYSFPEALDRLYGKPGSLVDVRVLRSGALKGETFSLKRGMLFQTGLGLTVRKDSDSVVVKKVLPESPAAKAEILEGDVLLGLGTLEAASLSDEELRAKLRQDMTGPNAPTFQRPDQPPRKIPLVRASFSAPIEANIFEEEQK